MLYIPYKIIAILKQVPVSLFFFNLAFAEEVYNILSFI